jgi:hypothetical protein
MEKKKQQPKNSTNRNFNNELKKYGIYDGIH